MCYLKKQKKKFFKKFLNRDYLLSTIRVFIFCTEQINVMKDCRIFHPFNWSVAVFTFGCILPLMKLLLTGRTIYLPFIVTTYSATAASTLEHISIGYLVLGNSGASSTQPNLQPVK